MKGVGPATAAAILSFGDTSGQCPFLSDEAMQAFGIVGKAGKLEYTVKSWEALKKLCDEKAQELNKIDGELEERSQEAQDKAADADMRWTASTVEQALWADSLQDD